MITDRQVRTAIAVLNAYAAEEPMAIDDTLMAELTDAIENASNGWITCEINDDPPLAQSL